ncbi:MAG: 8-amino-7-oxononanoate synthase [Pseudomonadota bacterium]
MTLPPSWAARIKAQLGEIDAADMRRERHAAYDACGPSRRIAGQDYLSFASNDYLGLAGDARIADALANAAKHYGVGSGASHLLGGYTAAHQALEERLADWVGQPRALLFSTGYQANLAVITALAGKEDLVLEDRLNHASLIDAARLSGARFRRYLHRDPHSLARRLGKADAEQVLVATDSVFSMDGDLAPMAELQAVAAEHGALFVVDDAHGLGVLGPQGAGAAAAAGVKPDVLVATLGKAVGTFGAFVAGPEDVIELLVQRARSWIYTTAPPPALAAASLVAVEIARFEKSRRERLEALIRRFREGAATLPFELLPSTTPIQPLVLRSSERALAVSAALRERGIWAPAVRPPTVPADSARLRITLTAAHDGDDIDRLLDALRAIG